MIRRISDLPSFDITAVVISIAILEVMIVSSPVLIARCMVSLTFKM